MGATARAAGRAALNAGLQHPGAKPLVFLLALWPLAGLVWGALHDQLGANPAETLIRSTGDWALRFLCLTLAVTPLRVMAGLAPLLRLRRMLGLFTFFYAALHLLAYAWLDMGLEIADIARDVAKRPFILVGFASFALLTPLAVTSFNRAVRLLGGRRWQQLHRLVYPILLLVLLHFFWMRTGKRDFNEVAVYAAVAALLLGWRALRAWRARSGTPAAGLRR